MMAPTGTKEAWPEEFVLSYLELEPGKPRMYYHRYKLDLDWLVEEGQKVDAAKKGAADYIRSLGNAEPDMDTLRALADRDAEENSRWRFRQLARRVTEGLRGDPVKTLTSLNRALSQLVVRPGDEAIEDFREPVFEITGASVFLREINFLEPERDAGGLVTLRGVLLSLSDPPETEYVKKVFQCDRCARTVTLVKEPSKCTCGSRDFTFLEGDPGTERRTFQEAILQEHVEDLSRSAATVFLRFYGRDINRFIPGDRVRVTGILVLRRRDRKNTMQFWVEVASITVEGEKDRTLSENDIEEIRKFSKREDVLDALASYFVPEIVGYQEVKQAILLQAVSGEQRDHGSMSVRGRIHILLAGDPGKAKSQFLLADRLVEEKSLYLSDTSKAGLTVAVSTVGTKKVLVPGILVLANGGTACVDELDKMVKEDREGLHTAMEQGVISKSKAGLRGVFKANTSVLAAANPQFGRFDLARDIPDQLKIESTLLDRFDLIFWFIEKNETRKQHMEMAMRALSPERSPDPEFLRKYVSLAKGLSVDIPPESMELIAETYVSLKERSPNGVSIGLRSLHAIRRLSEASAKLRLSDRVEARDVETAKELIGKSLEPIGFDRDVLTTGVTGKMRGVMEFVFSLVKEGRGATYDDVLAEALRKEIPQFEALEAIEKLKRAGQLYEPSYQRLGVVG